MEYDKPPIRFTYARRRNKHSHVTKPEAEEGLEEREQRASG